MCAAAALEEQCSQLMMRKFGRLVDLEALMTLSGSRTLEELKQEKLLREAAYAKEIKQWDVGLPCVCLCLCLCDFVSVHTLRQVLAICTAALFYSNLRLIFLTSFFLTKTNVFFS